MKPASFRSADALDSLPDFPTAQRSAVGALFGSQAVTRSAASIPDTLKHFDLLPDSANVRQRVVQALCDCSAATVWRMVKRGDLPTPRKLSPGVTAWNVGDLRKALAG